MNTQNLSEQEIIRREKLAELKKLGIDAYPAALYPVNTTAAYIKAHYVARPPNPLAPERPPQRQPLRTIPNPTPKAHPNSPTSA